MTTQTNPNKVIAYALLVIALLAGAYFWYDSHKINREYNFKNSGSKELPQELTAIENGVEVSSAGVGTTVMSVPQDFPTNIPVEGKIVESFRANYTEQKVVQYTVSYNSTKTKDALWNTYIDFFNKNKYVVDLTATNKGAGAISATKDNDTLSVAITTPKPGSTYVQLNLLDR